MVLRSIKRIKAILPEVLHVVMFYNNGTIFQTTFDQQLNIPKLGENLSEILNHAQKIYEICELKMDAYKKLIYETNDIYMIIIKLGEDSNLALFFKKEERIDEKLKSIRRYIKRIEELIDMEPYELEFQQLEILEENLGNLNREYEEKQQEIQNLKQKLKESKQGILEDLQKEISKEIEKLNEECFNLINNINKLKKQEEVIKDKVDKERKK